MRIWQTRFQVVQGFESLPAPNEIVYERQTGPEYHMDEARRPQVQAAQIVCTISGEGVFRQRDKLYTLTPGMAFIAKNVIAAMIKTVTIANRMRLIEYFSMDSDLSFSAQ